MNLHEIKKSWEQVKNNPTLQLSNQAIEFLIEQAEQVENLKNEISRKYLDKKSPKKNHVQSMKKNMGISNSYDRPQMTNRVLLAPHLRAERLLLTHMLHDKKIFEKVQKEYKGKFCNEHFAMIYQLLINHHRDWNAYSVELFMSFLPSELHKIVMELMKEEITFELSDRELRDYIDALNNYDKQQKIKELEPKLKKAERDGDFVLAAEILQQITATRSSMKYVK